MEDISCIDCAITLTDEEAHYYKYRCEDCEQAWTKRINTWTQGGEDEELDALFSISA